METFNDALVEAVKALGGSKVVGPMLWPEKTLESAQRQLLDCLNPERPNRLNPDQVVFILRKAREINCHVAAEWLMAHLGYAKPVPVEPREELAGLQREFIAATKDLQGMVNKIQSLQQAIQNFESGRPHLRAAF